jgi:5-methylcytosine-specific restriction endonuclease McrA
LKDWGCAKLDTKRTFTKKQIDDALHKQNYICPKCDIEISEKQKTGGHITTYCFGGKTEDDNLRVLHKNCNTYDHVKEVA